MSRTKGRFIAANSGLMSVAATNTTVTTSAKVFYTGKQVILLDKLNAGQYQKVEIIPLNEYVTPDDISASEDGSEKLSVEGQIDYLKKRGVKFVLVSEGKASEFLEDHLYFFKVKAYAKAFKRNTNKNLLDYGKYYDLDFKQLMVLSEIDMRLRMVMLQITLGIGIHCVSGSIGISRLHLIMGMHSPKAPRGQ